jgi:hypothetical protein
MPIAENDTIEPRPRETLAIVTNVSIDTAEFSHQSD